MHPGPAGPWPDDANIIPREAFIPQRRAYLGRTCLEPGRARKRSLVHPEKTVTNQASAKATTFRSSPFFPTGSLSDGLADAFMAVRNETERRAAPLSPEDQQIQSMPDASPAKWHRAHTTWFWEQFLLGDHCPGYRPFHADFGP